MTRSKASSAPQPESPQVSPQQGQDLLKTQVSKADQLLGSRPLSSDDYSSWELVTRNYLEKAFGRHSPNISSVMDVGKYGSFPMGANPQWWDNHRAESLTTQKRKLEGLIELLRTEAQLVSGTPLAALAQCRGHAIFLVHGHDDRALHEVARFLERLGQKIVILREQPNLGKTIIEKFEAYADVGFAVVLLTGDDKGGPGSVSEPDLMPRARQNVIFELGYFIGRLGRNRVSALYTKGVELPSDYSGILYIELDESGAWRLQLAKELKAASLPLDMNLAL